MHPLLFLLALLPLATRLAPAQTTPVARLISVTEHTPRIRGKTGFPGAAIRAFDPPPPAGPMVFAIRWYTPPPGLPAGALLYLECVQKRTSDIRTFFAPQQKPVSGYVDTRIEIPADLIRTAGPPLHWQISLVWRGHLLDRWASATGWPPPTPLPRTPVHPHQAPPPINLPRSPV